jgi:hypothetical protein
MQTTTPTTRPNHATTLAVIATGLAIAEMALFFYRTVDEFHPPSLTALLCGIAALFAGIAAIFTLRGKSATSLRMFAILATLCGLSATFIFGYQAVDWRWRSQERERSNVQTLNDASRQFALNHDHTFPPDLSSALAAAKIPGATLLSPLSDNQQPAYLYSGAGINASLWNGENFDARLVTIYSTEPRLGDNWLIGTADGTVKILTEEEFAKALDANDQARKSAGLPPADFHLPWHVSANATEPALTTTPQ